MPAVPRTASLSEAMLEMSRKGMGMTAVVDAPTACIAGIFTDGDLRRALDKGLDDLRKLCRFATS